MNFYDFYVAASQLSTLPPATTHPLVAYYLGPDTVLPVVSIIAAVIGVILMFGRNVIGFLRMGVQTVLRRGQAEPTPSETDDSQN